MPLLSIISQFKTELSVKLKQNTNLHIDKSGKNKRFTRIQLSL